MKCEQSRSTSYYTRRRAWRRLKKNKKTINNAYVRSLTVILKTYVERHCFYSAYEEIIVLENMSKQELHSIALFREAIRMRCGKYRKENSHKRRTTDYGYHSSANNLFYWALNTFVFDVQQIFIVVIVCYERMKRKKS